LRRAYLFACKSPLKYWFSALFLQEYTGGRTGGFSVLVDGRKMRLGELKNTRCPKAPV
jgi:hypothetical protein